MTTQGVGTIEMPATVMAGPRAVTFEAPEIEGLSRQVTAWLLEHPSAAVLAFSHAAETRSVVREPVSLAGPEPRVFCTGVLLVRA